ncbi:CPBP family intramembrane glutamic endopeptidase [Streptosporangium sp. NPDC003464]
MDSRSPMVFFGVVFALAAPFWVAGTSGAKLPGLPMDLPVGALMFVCPFVAAAVLSRRHGGTVLRLVTTTLVPRGRAGAAWLGAAFLLVPAVMVPSYVVASAVGAEGGAHAPLVAAPLLFAVFLVSAAAEEAGWTAYATDPLRRRLGALGAAVVLGTVWGVWHLVPLVQAGRSPAWTAWWFLGTVAARVIMVWVHRGSGGSVPSAVVFHAMLNVVPSLLPGYATDVTVVACAALFTTLVAVPLGVHLLREPPPHDPGRARPAPICGSWRGRR